MYEYNFIKKKPTGVYGLTFLCMESTYAGNGRNEIDPKKFIVLAKRSLSNKNYVIISDN